MQVVRLRAVLLAVLGVLALSLAACGESEAEKAKAQVCHSRSQIEKSVASLKNLPPSTSAFSTAKSDFESILNELKKISEETPKLEQPFKGQVESAQTHFKASVVTIVGELASGAANGKSAASKLGEAAKSLASSYKSTIASIKCS